MKITAIVPDGKTKSKIYLDGEYAGFLWNRELAGSSLTEERELTDAEWRELVETAILPRGRKKALDLLLVQERSRKELEDKLLASGYTSEQTNCVMQYVEQFPYLDDVRYALHYFCGAGKRKSFRQMQYELRGKGVSERDISEAYERYLMQQQEEQEGADPQEEPYERRDAEKAAIRRQVEKKFRNCCPEAEDWERLYASLARKGFRGEDILEVFREYR